jgi:strictosidine synthase
VGRLLKVVGLLLVLALVYLCFWPTPLEPVAWQPPDPPALTGVLGPNQALAGAEQWLPEAGGPEAIALDAQGRLVTGLLDGRIVAFSEKGELATIANTGGRPLGLKLDKDGSLVVADAALGLLRVDAQGTVTTLATEGPGGKFGFTDDVAIAADGTIYFTDASSHFGLGEYKMAVLEHAGDARLLSFKDGKVELIAGGLDFANGVALGPDDAYLVVTETSSYRIRRYWLTGEKKGQSEIFAENLPAFPDNITWSPSRKIFWVGCGSPRVKIVDLLAPYPFLRRMVGRLPAAVQPAPEKHQFVLGFDETGQIVHALQDPEGGYKPIASVLEHDGWLYLGSFSAKGVARVRAP